MRWLITGGRDYSNKEYLYEQLDAAATRLGTPLIVITGGARGVDTMALEWATSREIQTARCDANWERLGRRAGYVRNAAMLSLQPTHVFAFDGARGTQMMVDIARRSGLEVIKL